ncbi:vWA domain-containing protein [Halioxenophilus aromaticivorans]|uniref:VWA domain-containing protein n=1 Tax=Halioxenophilus aromaticivorans TaxID=1306992 RepID=A0AAV3U102_9ALTE
MTDPKQPSNHSPMDDLTQQMAHTPPPSSAAKAAARQAALKAFAEQSANHHQGFWARLRLTLNNRSQEGNAMQKKWIYSGALASLCVVGMTAVLVKTTQPELMVPVQSGVEPNAQATTEALAEAKAEVKQDASLAAELEAPSEVQMEPEVAMDMAAPQAIAAEPSKALPAKRLGTKELRQTAKSKAAEFAPSLMVRPAPQNILGDATTSGPVIQGEDEFTEFKTNPVTKVMDQPVSTFSIDVDTASYSFVRRQLNRGLMPQKDAVRLEEMVNYFDYQYPLPANKNEPFSTYVNVVESPWKPGNKLVHIGIKGYQIERNALPKSNLVFLLDVSGSMGQADKLPLVKQSMELLLSQLNPTDTVAIAVYAGAAGTVLPPTPVQDKQTIMQALNNLQAGGSTAGGEGIQLAYQLAEANYDKNAVNRVILATDGDFNVGIANQQELKGFIERKRDSGIYLSVLGFGQGNYHDNLMQSLAQNGNGVAAYIDTLSEAQKVLVHQATATLFTIAKDVKIQVEFNPATVAEYRLLGFETRMLEKQDFNNDKVDAGDIGAGHTVTAIYEITPVASENKLIDNPRYASNKPEQGDTVDNENANEYGFVKLRYKLPDEDNSKLISLPILIDQPQTDNKLQQEVNFSVAVAGFAQLLKGGTYTGNWQYDDVISLAQANKGEDEYGYRTEFIQLVRKAKMAKALP